jgi:hypothetical protein
MVGAPIVPAAGTGLAVFLVVAGSVAIGDRLFSVLLNGWPAPIVAFAHFGFDVPAAVLVALLLLRMQRQNLLGCLLAAALPLAVIAASAVKMAVLGQSALFGDISLLPDLRRTLTAKEKWLVDLALLGVVVLFLGNLRLDRGTTIALAGLGTAVLVPLGLSRVPAAQAVLIAAVPPRQVDFPVTGHVANAIQVAVQRLRIEAEVRGTPPAARLAARAGAARPARSVHMVVVESLIDPLWLPGFAWPAEPLSPLFARWRAESGGTALVPIFGSRSSNTEFEVLCGLPIIGGSGTVLFAEIPEGAALPCLPRVLAGQGFATLSLVPNESVFFRAANAFSAMGFARRLFAPDLDVADRDGPWLSADATLAQSRRAAEALLAEDPSRPVLSYAFINAGHYPFHRDRTKRPDRLAPQPPDSIVHDWANAAHYNALAVEAHVEAIIRGEPDALIIIVGDHNPPLGLNYAGYRTGGRMPADGTPPMRSALLHETPLLVIDRGRLVRTGRLPVWQVPELVLDLLSDGAQCRDRGCGHTEEWRLRPLDEVVLLVQADGNAVRICPRRGVAGPDPDPAACEAARVRTAALSATVAGLLRLAPSP